MVHYFCNFHKKEQSFTLLAYIIISLYNINSFMSRQTVLLFSLYNWEQFHGSEISYSCSEQIFTFMFKMFYPYIIPRIFITFSINCSSETDYILTPTQTNIELVCFESL